MAYRQFTLPSIGALTIYKRRRARSVRLTIAADGAVRISIPPWVPYKIGLDFARSKSAWILKQHRPITLITPNSRIGKAHRVVFYQSAATKTIRTRLKGDEIQVILPENIVLNEAKAQDAALKAGQRALKKEAQILLPQRLQLLAAHHGFRYRSVTIKHLKSRWGSCSQFGDVVLNSYLIQLPWYLTDYVILHELVHTKILAHGPVFWGELSLYVPNLSEIRKEMRSRRPVLNNLIA